MIIDAAVHPFITGRDWEAMLPKPWRDAKRPLPFGALFEAPFPDLGDREAASDPVRTGDVLFGERDLDAAVLSPLTLGLLPNPHHFAAVSRAANEWLGERWLDPADATHRVFGSIRVPITDTYAALQEIDRWVTDRRFVQIVVPLRTFSQFGDERYFPIWEAAAAAGMPVYVKDDLATTVEFPHSSVGQPATFAENDATRAMLAIVQLASLITAGVFERLPQLRFIFGDGGADLAASLLWRLDNDWRSMRVEVPWVTELPSEIAMRVARFVSQAHEQVGDAAGDEPDPYRTGRLEKQLIFGSHYPYWDRVDATSLVRRFGDAGRDAVLANTLLDVTPRLAEAILRSVPAQPSNSSA